MFSMFYVNQNICVFFNFLLMPLSLIKKNYLQIKDRRHSRPPNALRRLHTRSRPPEQHFIQETEEQTLFAQHEVAQSQGPKHARH